jgi:hypothetical protein
VLELEVADGLEHPSALLTPIAPWDVRAARDDVVLQCPSAAFVRAPGDDGQRLGNQEVDKHHADALGI